MIDNFIKKLYVKRFGELISKEHVEKLEKTISDLRINIKDLSENHKRHVKKLTNEHKDELNALSAQISELQKELSAIEEAKIAPKVEDKVSEKKTSEKKRKSRTQAKMVEEKK